MGKNLSKEKGNTDDSNKTDEAVMEEINKSVKANSTKGMNKEELKQLLDGRGYVLEDLEKLRKEVRTVRGELFQVALDEKKKKAREEAAKTAAGAGDPDSKANLKGDVAAAKVSVEVRQEQV